MHALAHGGSAFSSVVSTELDSAAFPLLGPDGTAGAPSYAFATSPDCGMWLVSDGVVAISSGSGTEAVRFDASQDATFAGTVGVSGSRVSNVYATDVDVSGGNCKVNGDLQIANSSAASPGIKQGLGAANTGVYGTNSGHVMGFSCDGGSMLQVENGGTAKLGFFATTPAAQAAAYTQTNVSTDRAYDADTVAVAELADVVGTLIADLQAYGLLQ